VSHSAAAVRSPGKHWWSPQPPPQSEVIAARRAYLEVLGVFAAFFGAGIIAAGFSLSSDLSSPTGGWGAFLPSAFDNLAQAGTAATLVLLLSRQRGISRQALGLVLPRRADGAADVGAALRVATWALVAFIGGSIVTSLLATGKYNVSPHLNAAYLVYTSTAAVNAGIVEEMVVLGFVVVTLQQARRPLPEVVLVALVLRASYHVYYGPGVVGILVWASVFVWLFLRTRSLLPIIAVHFVWDFTIFMANRWHWLLAPALLLVVGMVIAAPITWLVARAAQPALPWLAYGSGAATDGGWAASVAPPGWRPDPWGQRTWRWWDGTRWTDTTA
jgi:membrane protease YdiL (CAAX protease family)